MSGPITITVRNPGPPGTDWHERVEWPAGYRIPMRGEIIDTAHGQFVVESVQWLIKDDGVRVCQVIVR